MSSSKKHVENVIEQLNMASGGKVSSRAMMGEYVVYYRDKVVGGIYDNRFLIKPTESARRLLPKAPFEVPYKGAKEMLLVSDLDDLDALREMLEAVYPELPAPKPRKKKS